MLDQMTRSMRDIGCAKVELARELGSLGQQHSRQDLRIMASTAIRERVGDKAMIALEAPGQKRDMRGDWRVFSLGLSSSAIIGPADAGGV